MIVLPAARASSTARVTSRRPAPWPRNASGTLGVVDDDLALADLGEGHLGLRPAGPADHVAPLGAVVLEFDCRQFFGHFACSSVLPAKKPLHRLDFLRPHLVAALMPFQP